MRSPVIAFSLIAAAVSPTLVSGAPASPKLDNAIAHTANEAATAHHIRSAPNLPDVAGILGGAPQAPPATTPTDDPIHRTQAMKKAKEQAQTGKGPAMPATAPKVKRASDKKTAGGNAYSGAASDSSGGDVDNEANRGTVENDDGSNGAGDAGSSFSGFAFGGDGDGHGPGGNAYTGATGPSRGGNVINTSQGGDGDEDAINNDDANTAGTGGFSESGSAVGGDATGPQLPANVRTKRASDSGTAGGNAYSGATNDVSGGSVVNAADDGEVDNDGNTGGDAGTTFSGDADGGNGNGLGPGGNAYTGASGPAVGGSIYNYGGNIENEEDANQAGDGGVSETGDATGGRA